jgi:hypothetical protein
MRTALLLTIAAALLAAPAAQAKEIIKARVCGLDSCVTTRDPTLLQALMDGGPPSVPPTTKGGVISVRATVAEPGGEEVGQFTSWWVPAARMLVAEDGTWMRVPDAAPVLERLTDHFEPFPASTIGLGDEAAPPPAPAAADDGRGTPWALIAILAAALATGAAVTLRATTKGGQSPLIVRARRERPDPHRLRPGP